MKFLSAMLVGSLFVGSGVDVAVAQNTSGGTASPLGQAAPSATAGETQMSSSGNTSTARPSMTATPSGATVTQTMVTNGPVPDTPDNRGKYGAPLSRTGKHTKPAGN